MNGRSSIDILVRIVCLISLLVKYHSSFSDHDEKVNIPNLFIFNLYDFYLSIFHKYILSIMQTYIIYTGNTRNNKTSLLLHYKSLFQQVTKRYIFILNFQMKRLYFCIEFLDSNLTYLKAKVILYDLPCLISINNLKI